MKTLKQPRTPLKRLVLASACASALLISAGAFAKSPEIELFPVSVQESFKQAENHTIELQGELNQLAQELKQQETLYREAKCDSISDDPGCMAIKQQMKDKFMALNETIRERLPELKQAVNHAHKNLKKSLGKLGREHTPAELMELNRQAMASRTETNQGNKPKTSLGRLANIFSSLNKAIGSNQSNLYVLASQSYQDLELIKNELALMDENTQINAAVHAIGVNIDDISPETLEQIGGVRDVVMGETAGESNTPSLHTATVNPYDDVFSRY